MPEFSRIQRKKYSLQGFAVHGGAKDNMPEQNQNESVFRANKCSKTSFNKQGKQNCSSCTRQKWVMWNRHIQQPICSTLCAQTDGKTGTIRREIIMYVNRSPDTVQSTCSSHDLDAICECGKTYLKVQ